MERVSVMQGINPIILVAPHGFQADDENTALLTETMAGILNCYAVINRGWERADSVDIFKDKADCNNVAHCFEDVVREEFLEPIINYKNRILRKEPICYIYTMHGMSDKHRKIANDPKMDMVLGWGDGNPPSYSCDGWRKDAFATLLADTGMNVYIGKKGGQMSGWSRNNMNQLFRKHFPESKVQSMQIEVVHELRSTKDMVTLTANYIAIAMGELLTKSSFRGSMSFKKY